MRRRDFLTTSAAALAAERTVSFVEQQVPKLLDELNVPGLSAAIVADGILQWRGGFGVKDRASGRPVTPSTMFEAASMSKPVFAYAAMKLCETGVLGLDTPLSRYLPELRSTSGLDRVTARHVLSHTSGLPNWRKERELRIDGAPGEKYQYSGEGYYYLQSVITRLAGRVDTRRCKGFEAGFEVCATDFDKYMKARILSPFGMTASGYVWNRQCDKHMARPHDRDGKPMENKKSDAADVARYGSAGALLTTPTDYAKFVIEILRPKPADAFRLSAASRREMLRAHATVGRHESYTIGWSLGWRIARIDGRVLYSHGGDNTGFHSLAEFSEPRRSAFVVMTNGDNGPELLRRLAPEMSRRVHGLPAIP